MTAAAMPTLDDLVKAEGANESTNGSSNEPKPPSDKQVEFLADLRKDLTDADRAGFDVLFASEPVTNIRCSRLIRVALNLLGKEARTTKKKGGE